MSYDDRDDELDVELKKLHPAEPMPKCPSCGSDKIVPTAYLTGTNSALLVTVMAEPNAVIFKGYESEPVTVRLCGACGYIALFAENPTRLWSVFQRSVKNQLQRPTNPDEG